MARTDDDSWDITEGVGATALGVAMGRAAEARRDIPLFADPFAQLFLDAAAEAGWRQPYTEDMLGELLKSDPELEQRIQAMSGYTASRTKFFDDFFTTAGANGINQAVILAAGLDARAWRLPWVADNVVYEIDQPKVLAFKAETLRAHDVEPATRYVAVPCDLRQDWPAALRQSGFDPSEPTAWSAEGLLPYLPAAGQDLLFERVQALSAAGSRLAVEAFGPRFFDPAVLARRREQIARVREAAEQAGSPITDAEDLFFMEEHADVADWLAARGWQVSAIAARDLMTRYRRPAPEGIEDATIDTLFVEAHLIG